MRKGSFFSKESIYGPKLAPKRGGETPQTGEAIPPSLWWSFGPPKAIGTPQKPSQLPKTHQDLPKTHQDSPYGIKTSQKPPELPRNPLGPPKNHWNSPKPIGTPQKPSELPKNPLGLPKNPLRSPKSPGAPSGRQERGAGAAHGVVALPRADVEHGQGGERPRDVPAPGHGPQLPRVPRDGAVVEQLEAAGTGWGESLREPVLGFLFSYWGSHSVIWVSVLLFVLIPLLGVPVLLLGFLFHHLGSRPVTGVPVPLLGFLSCYLGSYPVIWVPVLSLGFPFCYWRSFPITGVLIPLLGFLSCYLGSCSPYLGSCPVVGVLVPLLGSLSPY